MRGTLPARASSEFSACGLTRERLGILSGQDGQLLDAARAPAADREGGHRATAVG
jgi:hypothetical protein